MTKHVSPSRRESGAPVPSEDSRTMTYLRRRNSLALLFGDIALSYHELLEALFAYGRLLPPGCRKVAICSENRPEWIFALYGAWQRGCTVVPLDSVAPPEEIAYMLRDCEPELLFCSRQTWWEIRNALASLPHPPAIRVFEECPREFPSVGQDVKALQRDLDETALIIYTSGTTGSPKGAMLSFRNMEANARAVTRDVPLFTPETRALVLLPIHHVLPLGGTIIAPLAAGGTCVFSPSMASGDILGTLQRHGVTVMVGVPRLFSLIMKGIRQKIQRALLPRMLFSLARRAKSPLLSKLLFRKVHQRFGGKIRYLICGGAPLDDDVARDFKALGFDLLTGYGMTETAPLISFTRPGTLRIGASGQISPVNQVRIQDGEILVRGSNVMQGYYHRPEETAAVIREGWLHTGDLGYVDAQGFLFVTGRKKDILVLPNGKNINPEELESRILGGFDAVEEIGICLHEEALHAVILPDFTALADKGVHAVEEYFRWEVIGEYNQTAAPSKKIMNFTLVKEELPKTRLGKIRRFLLPERIAKPHTPRGSTPEPETPVYLGIKGFLEKQTDKPLFPEAHLEIDLGMDSLDKVALATYLGASFGVKIGDEELLRYSTLGEMAAYVEREKVKMEEEQIDWGAILRASEDLELPRTSPFHITLGKLFRFLLRCYFRITVTGEENLPEHPFLLVANHQSYLDGLVAGTSLPLWAARGLYFYASEQTFQKGWQRRFITRHRVILVEINRDLKLSLQKLAAVLQRGDSLIIFPEGGVTRDGKMMPFRKTFAILGRELQIPLVPMALEGTYQALPRGERIPRFRQKIRVTFLLPVMPEDLSYEELAAKVRSRIQEKAEPS